MSTTIQPVPPIPALHLLDEQTETSIPKVGTGCPSIDHALQGGLSYGHITALEGARGTGKTLIALHILTTHLLSSPVARVAIIDTSGIHSPPYFLRDVVQARLGRDMEKVEGVLERVMVMRVFDVWGLCEGVEEVGKGLRELRAAFKTAEALEIADSEDESIGDYDNGGIADPSKSNSPNPPSALLLVDLLTPLFTALMQTSQMTALSLLHSLLRTLHHLTTSHSICTILLNSAYPIPNPASSTGHPASIFSNAPTYRPALGRSFGFCVDMRVYLSKVPKCGNDVEDTVLGKAVGGMIGVVEVLGERAGGREGRWGGWDCVPKWFTSSGLLARATTQPTLEQTADRDLEKWEPPKEKRWGSPNKPIGKPRGRRSRHMLESVADLQTEALGEPAQVIILRDPRLDDSRPPVNPNTTDEETPDTGNPTLIELLAKLEAERGLISQEDVNANIEALQLSPATVLSQEDFSKLADELCKGFTTAQLTGYIHGFEAKQPPRHPTEKIKRPAHLEEAEWTPVLVPRSNPSVDTGASSASARNLTRKRKLAERVLRRCWNVQTEEEYESIGQIELCLGHRELSLLLRERNSLMQRFSETHNCQVGVSRSRRIVQVTGRRYDAQNLVLALKETVKSIACAEFDLAPFLSLREGASRVDVIEESTIEAISRSTDTEIERALDRNKVNIYYWSWKTANLEKARRLLLARLELPNYSKSAIFTDTGSAAGSLALCRTNPDTELPLNERAIQWSRCRFALAKGKEIPQVDRDFADDIRPKEVSKNMVTTSSKSTIKRMWAFLRPVELENTAYGSHNGGAIIGKGEETTRLQPISAQTVEHSGKAGNQGLPLRWSAHPASIVSVKLGQIIHNTTGLPLVHPIQLKGLLSKDAKNRSFLSGFSGMSNLLRIMQPLETASRQYLSMRLIPSPWMSSGLESITKFPHIEISSLISDDTGEPQLSVVQAVVEENVADLMLPSMHADLRFSRRTNFTLLSPLLDRKVKEFVKSGELQVDSVRTPGAPPYVELQVPKRLTRGISTPELELADDVGEQGVLVQYNLVGLDVQHRVEFDYYGWRVTYSDTNSGKVRGRRKELLMTMTRNTPGVDRCSISESPLDFPAFFDDARRLVTEIEDSSPKCPSTVSANGGVTEPVQPGGVLLGTAEV